MTEGKSICTLHSKWSGEVKSSWTRDFDVVEFFLSRTFLSTEFTGGSVPSRVGGS